MIGVRCPKCAAAFAVEDAMRGRHDRCPRCATPVPVPAEAPPAAPAVPILAHRHTILDDDSDVGGLPPDFDRYFDALSAAVVAQAELFAPTGPGADLYVTAAVPPGGRVDLSASVAPVEQSLDAATLARLFQALLSVPVPQAGARSRRAVQATLVFAVRGGSGRPWS